MSIRFAGLLSGASLAVIACATGAYAQSATSNDNIEEVVVTGSLIRDIKPAGQELIGISAADIEATGAITTDQLLSNVPGLGGYFNGLPQINVGSGHFIQVNTPTLHGVSNSNIAAGTSTLVLLNGHLIVPAGATQFRPDADIIPASVIDHVDILADGASATYGSNAVSGVINFITKKNFDGVQVDASYGAADNYNQNSETITGGHSWQTGSAFVSYSRSYNDALFEYNRTYAKDLNWATGQGISNECATPNVFVGKATPANYVSSGPEQFCDPSQNTNLYPEQKHDYAFGGVTQQLASWLTFDATAYYSKRTEISTSGTTFGGVSGNIKPSSPYYEPVAGHPGATQTVLFDLSPALSPYKLGLQNSNLSVWGVTPTLTADIGSTWQARLMFNYGQSDTNFWQQEVNVGPNSAASLVGSGMLNPYNVADPAAANQAALAKVFDYQNYGDGKDKMVNPRLIFDGEVITLPAGAVHAAIGGEFISNDFTQINGFSALHAQNTLPSPSYTQKDRAVFAEVQIPIFGPGFALPLVQSFTITGSVRYDDYDDFGVTYNPKVGASWQPVDWINLRGDWGTSFQAPTPVDELGAINNQILSIAGSAFPLAPPGVTFPTGDSLVYLSGSSNDLRPQTGSTKNFGVDVSPPWVPNLTASVSYYNIHYADILGTPNVVAASDPEFFRDFPQDDTLNPTVAQILAFAAQAPNGTAAIKSFFTGGIEDAAHYNGQIFELVNHQTQNLGKQKTAGFDMSLRYSHDTDFGSVDFSASSNLSVESVGAVSAAAAYRDSKGPTFDFSATAGANWGSLRAQATLNHNQGYHLDSNVSPAIPPQTHVDSFNVVNLFFRYDLTGLDCGQLADESICDKAAVTFNVGNLFDQNPPVYKVPGGLGMSNGFTNGQTLGRLFQIGISKRF